jgi:hypothetical protein
MDTDNKADGTATDDPPIAPMDADFALTLTQLNAESRFAGPTVAIYMLPATCRTRWN